MAVSLGSIIFGQNKSLVRNSSGIPYILQATTAYVLDMLKGNSATPTSFTQQDTSNNPVSAYTLQPSNIYIDSADVIHLCVGEQTGKTSALQYITFDTTTDTWGTGETVATMSSDPAGIYMIAAICVDQNDIPHVAYRDFEASMGTTYRTLRYANRIGGSWSSSVSVVAASSTTNTDFPCIECSPTNGYPYISWVNTTSSGFNLQTSTSNNPSSFSNTVIGGVNGSVQGSYANIAFNSAGNCYVGCSGGSAGLGLYDVTAATMRRDTTSPKGVNDSVNSVIAVGTDVYVFNVASSAPNASDLIGYKWDGTTFDTDYTSYYAAGSGSAYQVYSQYRNFFDSSGTDYGNGSSSGLTEVSLIQLNSGTDYFDTFSLPSGPTSRRIFTI